CSIIFLQVANQPPTNAANRSLTRLRLSAVKSTMPATSSQQGTFSIWLDGSICKRGLILRCNFLWFPKNKLFAAYQDLVLVVEPNRLMHTPLVQEGFTATA